ncbi:Integrase core domain [Popillia japonica]|uniref:RNA-directed DNA polymerase n=1 Tax=Popillia japonica TaxID=7064 RepID=A0AAW1JEB5_POPJA
MTRIYKSDPHGKQYKKISVSVMETAKRAVLVNKMSIRGAAKKTTAPQSSKVTLFTPFYGNRLILGVDFLELFNITVNFSDKSNLPSLCVINTICSYDKLPEQEKMIDLESVTSLFRQIGPDDGLGKTDLITHHIDNGNAKPFKQRQYPLSPAMQQHLNSQIDQMLQLGIIQPSQSPWCSPLWLVKKPNGTYRDGLRTDPDKVSAIVNYPVPKNTTQIKSLIGLVGYYRRFLKNFSAFSSPITDLLHGRKKGQPIKWTAEADKALQAIKHSLTTAPVLASPDYTKPFVINCDASDTGVGAVLYQTIDGVEHPIAYMSKNLNKCQRKYSTTEKELLAVLVAVEKFRSYVEGTRFTVVTDHHSLIWLSKLSNPTGSLNVVADALSREISVLNLETLKTDHWYREMLIKVREQPEKYPSFRVEGNILYKHILNRCPVSSNLSEWKIVVPTPNRAEILKMDHDDQTEGHLGVSKTLSRVLELYYWPTMRKDIFKYVRKCSICASCKTSNLPNAGLMGSYKNINFPFQLISAGLLGLYPRSKNGNQYLLVVVDWFTKYCVVQPLAKATSKAIVKFIENQVFLIYGVPQIFVCDNGPQFRSTEFQNLMKEYKVHKIWYNARYHPQINGTERQNRVIVTAIRSYIRENHKTWDLSIHKVAQAIRLARHDVTRYSPAFLTFARNIPLSGDYYGSIAHIANNIPLISDRNSRLNDIQKFPELYHNIRQKIFNSYAKNKQNYNLRRRSVQYKVGDLVWKANYVLSSAPDSFAAKLAPKFIPAVIKEKLSR